VLDLQDVIKTFLDAKPGRKWEELAEKVAVQLNDTHPSIGVAELMRLLIDVHGVGW
jgi:starch phosphorylase